MADAPQEPTAVKVTVPLWLLPLTSRLKVTEPEPPDTVAFWPDARLTEIWEELVFPVLVIVVIQLALLTVSVTDLVTLLPILCEAGLAVRVHGPVVG